MENGRPFLLQATKSVSQPHGSEILRRLLKRCLTLTYNAIEYGEENFIDDRRGMNDFYRSLKGVDIPSCLKHAIVARACTVLKSREKGARRGKDVKHRKALRPMVCLVGGFFTTVTGKLFISLGHDKYEMVQLNRYALRRISEPELKVRSLTITRDSISLCYSRKIRAISVKQ
jgi:hypothetical protein